jgi:hypothetical protein
MSRRVASCSLPSAAAALAGMPAAARVHAVAIVPFKKDLLDILFFIFSPFYKSCHYFVFDLAIRRLFKDFLRDRHSCNQSREENAIFMPKAFFLMPCNRSFRFFL